MVSGRRMASMESLLLYNYSICSVGWEERIDEDHSGPARGDFDRAGLLCSATTARSVRIERAGIGSDSGYHYGALVRRISEDGQRSLA